MLPLLQRLAESRPDSSRRRPRALVLTPTRELAAQVAESARDYGRYLKFETAVVYGGAGINPQISNLCCAVSEDRNAS